MKTAKVVPIYKAGDKHILTNNRPITLLSQFFKILEKIFCRRLDEFVTKNNVLYEQQYGFRNQRTMAYALTKFVDVITTAAEN